MGRMMAIIEYPNGMLDEVVHTFPESGLGVYYIGTTIKVRQDQNVVFRRGGELLDIFGPGVHIMHEGNISRIIKNLGDKFNDRTPYFSSEVFFVHVNAFQDRKWSTSAPMLVGGPRTGRAVIQAWGKYSFIVSDPLSFMRQFDLPSAGGLKATKIEGLLQKIIVPNIQKTIADICASFNEPLLDILSYRRKEISEQALNVLNKECSSLGIAIKLIFLEGFELAENNNELLRAWTSAHKLERIGAFEKIDPKFIFVITAFQEDMEPVFISLEAAARAVGLIAKRVKDVPGDYRITDRIIEMIHQARFIVADLTHERPNVYFELGYARGLGKKVVTLAREGTNVHFDVKDWTYISYKDLRILQSDLKKRFEFELSNDESS